MTAIKKYELDKEEKTLLKAFEEGKLKSVKNLKKEIARYQSYAQAPVAKQKINVEIELTFRELQKLKEKAAHKGIPYKHLTSSVLRQYGSQ